MPRSGFIVIWGRGLLESAYEAVLAQLYMAGLGLAYLYN